MIQYQLNNLFFSANQKEIIKTKAKEKQEKTQNQKSSFDLKLLIYSPKSIRGSSD